MSSVPSLSTARFWNQASRKRFSSNSASGCFAPAGPRGALPLSSCFVPTALWSLSVQTRWCQAHTRTIPDSLSLSLSLRRSSYPRRRPPLRAGLLPTRPSSPRGILAGGGSGSAEVEERSSGGQSDEWPTSFEWRHPRLFLESDRAAAAEEESSPGNDRLLPRACGRRAVSADRAAAAGINCAATTVGRASVLELQAALRVELARGQGDRPPGASAIFVSLSAGGRST
ncbi:unnamed protein product [Urochloa humidicola]